MLVHAYEIGIHPDEFFDLTPHEFVLCCEAHRRKDLADMRKRAWEVAHQVNLWAKDPISPGQLLGERPAETAIYTSVEEWRAHMSAKKERIERLKLQRAREAKRQEKPRGRT